MTESPECTSPGCEAAKGAIMEVSVYKTRNSRVQLKSWCDDPAEWRAMISSVESIPCESPELSKLVMRHRRPETMRPP
jgi:hypothetical protein